jgi:hypothetical protein
MKKVQNPKFSWSFEPILTILELTGNSSLFASPY